MRARTGASRADMDAAAKDLQIHELPSARGCTYVVPACDFALALKVGQGYGEESEIAQAIKYLGVTSEEIDRLCEGVLRALDGKVRDPRELKADLGDQVRSLGDAGKKRGTTSTLPLALGRLQAQGQIRRVPMGGRLDQQRFAYTAWSPSPLAGSSMSKEEAMTELARKYFDWIGPARIMEFQWFTGSTVKASKEAVEPLGLVEAGDGLLLSPDIVDEFDQFQRPARPCYSLVGSIDGIMHHRRETGSLVEPANLSHPLLEKDAGAGRTLLEVNDHAILDRGELIGLWQFDPAEGRIVWATFSPAEDELRRVIAETEAWIRDDLGDARSFSLDSPESRKGKIGRIREYVNA